MGSPNILRRRIASIATIFAITTIAFVAGESLAARYALVREIQLQAQILARNGPILASCKIDKCDPNLQAILIQANDTAMRQYTLLNKTYGDLLHRYAYYTTWPFLFSFYSSQKDIIDSGRRTIEYYEKLGCGLNGVACEPQH